MTFTQTGPLAALSQERASGIVRQRVHDLRNYMNGLDLQAQLLAELVEDHEAQEIVNNMRRQIQELETSIKWLSIQFSPPALSQVAALDLMQLWQQQANLLLTAQRQVTWDIRLQQQALEVDLRAVVAALRELVIETWKRSQGKPLQVDVGTEGAMMVIEVRVPEGNPPPAAGPFNDIARVLEGSGVKLELTPSGGGTMWVARLYFECATS